MVQVFLKVLRHQWCKSLIIWSQNNLPKQKLFLLNQVHAKGLNWVTYSISVCTLTWSLIFTILIKAVYVKHVTCPLLCQKSPAFHIFTEIAHSSVCTYSSLLLGCIYLQGSGKKVNYYVFQPIPIYIYIIISPMSVMHLWKKPDATAQCVKTGWQWQRSITADDPGYYSCEVVACIYWLSRHIKRVYWVTTRDSCPWNKQTRL